MKTIILTFSLVLFFQSLNSQQITELEKTLDSLKSIKDYYRQKIVETENEYSRIEKILIQKRIDQTTGESYVCVSGTNIVKSPDKYEVVANLPSNSKVKLLGQNDTYYKILFNNYIGWVPKAALKTENEVLENKKVMREKEIADSIRSDKYYKEELQRKVQDYMIRKERLSKKYGTEIANKILNESIWLGMTDAMALESWGVPDANNRSVGSWGVHEQWVYRKKNTNLYFENGKLTSWQD
jgi:hypothetical protein